MRLAVALLLLSFAGAASAHRGEVDSNGCHETGAGKRHCHPERARVANPDPARRPRAGEEGVFDGPLLWVTDGDSLRVMIRGRDTEVRLADVDAPEREQPYGWHAKLQLIELVRDKPLLVVPRDVDQYGRIVGWVWAGDVAINQEMVARGSAWFYSKYADGDAFQHIEKEARDANRGLWALPVKDRKEPWVWRRAQSQGGGREGE
jgi:endonuclease YncB( thermonuclease family)